MSKLEIPAAVHPGLASRCKLQIVDVLTGFENIYWYAAYKFPAQGL